MNKLGGAERIGIPCSLLIKEQVRIFDSAKYYDVYDFNTNKIIASCSEKVSLIKRILRNTAFEAATSFFIKLSFNKDVIYLRRKGTLFLSKVDILDNDKKIIATFQENFTSLGQSIKIFDSQGKQLIEIVGDILAWNFTFLKNGETIATVERKFSGALKEIFTKADNYKITFDQEALKNEILLQKIVIAATICIDAIITDGFSYFRNSPLKIGSMVK